MFETFSMLLLRADGLQAGRSADRQAGSRQAIREKDKEMRMSTLIVT